MFRPLSFYILFCLSPWASVNANTEIRNFEAIERHEIVILQTSKWPTLHPGTNQSEWSLELASVDNPLGTESPHSVTSDSKTNPHEMWVVLDVDHEEWKFYSKFTLRISWPASSPASFFMQIYTSESLLARITKHQHTSNAEENTYTSEVKTTRQMYAHIRAVDETEMSSSPQRVQFHVILEPLVMGVLPASAQPTVLALILVVSLAALAVPWINQYLERLAREAIKEVAKAKEE